MNEEVLKQQAELHNQMVEDARKYAFNIMVEDKKELYSPEAYKELTNKYQGKIEQFTDFSVEQVNMNIEHLTQGYGVFGKEFLQKVIDKDKDSLLAMFETVTQEFLQLNEFFKEQLNKLEQHKQELEKEGK